MFLPDPHLRLETLQDLASIFQKRWINLLSSGSHRHLATQHIHKGCLSGTRGAHDGLSTWSHRITVSPCFFGGDTFGKEVMTFCKFEWVTGTVEVSLTWQFHICQWLVWLLDAQKFAKTDWQTIIYLSFSSWPAFFFWLSVNACP